MLSGSGDLVVGIGDLHSRLPVGTQPPFLLLFLRPPASSSPSSLFLSLTTPSCPLAARLSSSKPLGERESEQCKQHEVKSTTISPSHPAEPGCFTNGRCCPETGRGPSPHPSTRGPGPWGHPSQLCGWTGWREHGVRWSNTQDPGPSVRRQLL